MKTGLSKMAGFFLFLFILQFVESVQAAEVYIPDIQTRPGEEFKAFLKIDDAANFAGTRLTVRYDPRLITFVKGKRTSLTDSFMHLINDKRPGFLVLVMAAARGIRVEDAALAELTFKASRNIETKSESTILITGLELMSESLEEIDCVAGKTRLTIHPQLP